MTTPSVLLLVFCILGSLCLPDSAVAVGAWKSVYTSHNLVDFIVNPECNPGGATACEGCGADDVAIDWTADYGLVTANSNWENIWVNAVGGKKFNEVLPDNTPVSLTSYTYRYRVRLPTMPAADVNQTENPEGLHLVMILWDGRDKLFTNNKTSIEAGLYWSVNAWNEVEYGSIKLWTGFDPIVKTDTVVTVTPDTEWHTFELTADFAHRRYISMTIDGQTLDISDIGLARVHRPDWGDDVTFIITAESMSAFPLAGCGTVYSYTAHFQDAELRYLKRLSPFLSPLLLNQ